MAARGPPNYWGVAEVTPPTCAAPAFLVNEHLAAVGDRPATRGKRNSDSCSIERRADRILDLKGGVYRASHTALYSSYQLPTPPDPLTDKRVGRSTDISREL
jgi:hypothetical protein